MDSLNHLTRLVDSVETLAAAIDAGMAIGWDQMDLVRLGCSLTEVAAGGGVHDPNVDAGSGVNRPNADAQGLVSQLYLHGARDESREALGRRLENVRGVRGGLQPADLPAHADAQGPVV